MILPILVLTGMALTVAFFGIYLSALHIALEEDRKANRLPNPDPVGKALMFAARWGFIAGVVAIFAQMVLTELL